MFANCQKGGTNMAGPDVCKTPVGSAVVPIPYPNIAAGATANPATAAKKVLISGMPAHNLRTTIPVSNGDNPGVVGGVMSGRVMGPCKHTMGVDSVLIGGSPATKMTNMTGQNGSNSNTKGATIAPAQPTVMIMKGSSAPSTNTTQVTVGQNTVTWKTDAQGRPIEASGSLKEYYKGSKRSSAEAKAQKAAAKLGKSSDHGGHLAAHRFVGDQGGKNLFPQNKQFNNSAFKTLENDYGRFIDQGHEVKFKHTLLDVDKNGRPGKVAVEYAVYDKNGKFVTGHAQEFKNEAKQKYKRKAK